MNESEIQFYATLKRGEIKMEKSERMSICYKIHKRAMFLYGILSNRLEIHSSRGYIIKNFLRIPDQSLYFSLSLSPHFLNKR